MHLISSVLFAVSANVDTLIIGISCGIRKSYIPFLEAIIISLITFTGTFLSIHMGLQITAFIPAQAAQIFGCVILILLGIYYVIKPFLKKEEPLSDPDKQKPHKLSLKEAILIGLALSINNVGMGIGASISGVPLIPTSLITLVVCILFLIIGNHIGKIRFFFLINRFADTVAGLILVCLGVYELFV